MIPLKPLKIEATAPALDKAKRYRFLNEPDEAESICLDILAAQPDNQEALITLLLALTDKFRQTGITPAFEQALDVLSKLDSSYNKAYYHGVILERRAKFHLHQGGPGGGVAAHDWFVKAMEAFDEALAADDPKSNEAVLRWNSCARILNSRPDVKADESSEGEMLLDTFETPH